MKEKYLRFKAKILGMLPQRKKNTELKELQEEYSELRACVEKMEKAMGEVLRKNPPLGSRGRY